MDNNYKLLDKLSLCDYLYTCSTHQLNLLPSPDRMLHSNTNLNWSGDIANLSNM